LRSRKTILVIVALGLENVEVAAAAL